MTPPDPDPALLPGLDLSRTLYKEAVRPILDAEYPGLRYAAARIGSGSEVLGFDTARSADHEWGPRLDLFLEPADAAAHGERLHRLLAERFAQALARSITDPELRALPLTGSVDQWADSTDFLGRQGAVRAAVDALG
ncbi:hypothetical protein ACH4MN_29380 [Streptomyces anulatus]|uniref:hypothetical protein n=1 Tax=unclassified Streptomyces TaxID=2593676 RepID=UPI0008516402|nr:hypothetical protein [Streptomyces sp. 404i]MBQ1117104.1 hypothetical protein [Streptomyces sp. C3-3]